MVWGRAFVFIFKKIANQKTINWHQQSAPSHDPTDKILDKHASRYFVCIERQYALPISRSTSILVTNNIYKKSITSLIVHYHYDNLTINYIQYDLPTKARYLDESISSKRESRLCNKTRHFLISFLYLDKVWTLKALGF